MVVCLLTAAGFAADKDETKATDRIKAAGTVLDEIEAALIRAFQRRFWAQPNAWPSYPPC